MFLQLLSLYSQIFYDIIWAPKPRFVILFNYCLFGRKSHGEKKWHDDVLVEKRDKNEKSMYRYNNKRSLLNANSSNIDSLYASELLLFSKKKKILINKGEKVHNNVNFSENALVELRLYILECVLQGNSLYASRENHTNRGLPVNMHIQPGTIHIFYNCFMFLIA